MTTRPCTPACVLAGLLLFLPCARANVEEFKAFLASPPTHIRNLVYRVRTAGDSTPLALAYDSSQGAFIHSQKLADSLGPRKNGLDKQGFRWFLARWQPNAFLVRGIDPEPEGATLASNPEVFRSGGQFFTNYWNLFGGTLQTWTAPSPLSPETSGLLKSNKTSSAHRGALVASMNLRQLLNLGIMSVNPGTIHWEEDHFQIDSLDISGVKIKGTLIVEKGRVSRMKLFYNEFPYLIEYAYSNKLSVPIPDRFLVTYLGSGKPEFRYEFEVLSMQTSSEPLGPEWFDPSQGVETIAVGEKTYHVHTSAERHWVYTDGGAVRLNRPFLPAPPDDKP